MVSLLPFNKKTIPHKVNTKTYTQGCTFRVSTLWCGRFHTSSYKSPFSDSRIDDDDDDDDDDDSNHLKMLQCPKRINPRLNSSHTYLDQHVLCPKGTMCNEQPIAIGGTIGQLLRGAPSINMQRRQSRLSLPMTSPINFY